MPLTIEHWKIINPGTPSEDAVYDLEKINIRDLIGGKLEKVLYDGPRDRTNDVLIRLKDGRVIHFYSPEPFSLCLWDCDQNKAGCS